MLSVFRFYAALRLGLLLFPVVIWMAHRALGLPFGHEEHGHATHAAFSLAEAALIVVFLWWPRIRERLGRFFLPLGLAVITIGPIVGQYLHYWEQHAPSMPDETGAVRLAVALLVPLLLTGWQYGFRAVVLFTAAVALIEVCLITTVVGLGNPHVFGVIVHRSVVWIFLGYVIGRLVTAQRQERAALAQANARLAQFAATLERLTVNRERNRLARELHDTLAHTLSGIAVQLEAVKTLWDADRAKARSMLEQSLAAARNGLTETRQALQSLRATPLEDLGLVLALRDLCESVAARTGATVSWSGPQHLTDMPPAVEQAVYRIAQEALENIVRHSEADEVSLKLHQSNGHFTLEIVDNGRGFDLDQIGNEPCFGLTGMRERAEMVGGVLQIWSRPGAGTTVRLILDSRGSG